MVQWPLLTVSLASQVEVLQMENKAAVSASDPLQQFLQAVQSHLANYIQLLMENQ